MTVDHGTVRKRSQAVQNMCDLAATFPRDVMASHMHRREDRKAASRHRCASCAEATVAVVRSAACISATTVPTRAAASATGAMSVTRGVSDHLDRPRPAVHRAGKVLVDTGRQRLLAVHGPPGDESPRSRHAVETGIAQHRDPPRCGMRALLQMRRPLHHRCIADDHRLVGLVDVDRSLAQCCSARPRLKGEMASRRETGPSRQHIQKCFGNAVARRRTPPLGRPRRTPSAGPTARRRRRQWPGACRRRGRARRAAQATEARCCTPTFSMTSAPTRNPSRPRIAAPISASRERNAVSASSRSTAPVSSSSANP